MTPCSLADKYQRFVETRLFFSIVKFKADPEDWASKFFRNFGAYIPTVRCHTPEYRGIKIG
jgi:hypothetical protein